MTSRPRLASLTLSFALVSALAAPAVAQDAAIPEAVKVVAHSLATHYNVPVASVDAMLQEGVSMQTLTQLLIVKQSSGQSWEKVTDTWEEQGDDIDKTAAELQVAKDKYSAKNVQAAIDKAKADTASRATDKAAGEANKAVGSMLGGMTKE